MEFKVPEKQTFKIGEVCDLLQVETHTLRFWESEFEELNPQKNPMGQRVYRSRDIQVAQLIKKLLYEEGYTIAGAKKQLKKEIVRITGEALLPDREEILEELRKMRWQLKELLTLLGGSGK